MVSIKTEEQTADILTKSLNKVKFEKFREALGMVCRTILKTLGMVCRTILKSSLP